VSTVGLQLWSKERLPLIDFRAYKVGANIPDGMKIPEGEKPPKYVNIYVMEHKSSGETKEVDSDTYLETKMWEDSLWQIKETLDDPVLKEEGYEPPIHDFTMVTIYENEELDAPAGLDVTERILEDKGYSLLLTSPDVKDGDMEAFKQAGEIAAFCGQSNCHFYVMTASLEEDIQTMKQEANLADVAFFATDDKTLKTIIRANPGLVLIKEGTILAKWHHNNLPSTEELKELLK